MFDKLAQIQDLNKRKELLLIEEQNATKAILTDFELIPLLYKWFKEAQAEIARKEGEVTKRREFLFIVLYLYAPKSLIKGHLPDGLRDTLVNALNSVNKSSISNDINYLYLFYKQYINFRNAVEYAYAFIMDKLSNEKLLLLP